jgi:hypothetical protein
MPVITLATMLRPSDHTGAAPDTSMSRSAAPRPRAQAPSSTVAGSRPFPDIRARSSLLESGRAEGRLGSCF